MIKNITNDNPSFKPKVIPLSLVLWLAKTAITKKLIAVRITDSLLIVILLIPVKLIKEVIIAIPIIKTKNKPKYFKYINILFNFNHLINYINFIKNNTNIIFCLK